MGAATSAPAAGFDWLAAGRDALSAEVDALAAMRDALGGDGGGGNDDKSGGLAAAFCAAAELIFHLPGKVACTGVGKSGHIARKAAATFSSTGTPAFFLHPTEAGHGDMGAFSDGDGMLALSYSGESAEIAALLPALRRMRAPLVVISGGGDSTLAQVADVFLPAQVAREACPNNLAPTASTTAALALTDALAVALLAARGFSSDDFARSHPAGALGRRLLTRTADVMRSGEALPVIGEGATLAEALVPMTGKRMGAVFVCGGGGELCGIFTDGDLRRVIAKGGGKDWASVNIADVMTPSPQSCPPSMLADRALKLMRERAVNQLAVVEGGRLAGALSFHDLLRHNII